jgi:xanthine dehydrogenase YagS FAD-binding subunit
MLPFTYTRPATVADAVRAKAAGRNGTRYLAGGTTLYDLMKLRVEQPTDIIDISGLSELSSIDTSGSRELVLGALAKMSDVAADARLGREYPLLTEALLKAASQQLRNMATVGGNLLQRTRCNYFRHGAPFPCNKRDPGSGCAAIGGIDRAHAVLGGSEHCIATYPGDWAIALLAADAIVDVQGPGGRRSLPVGELHRLPGSTPERETTLADDDLIVRIRIPVSGRGRTSAYHKVRDRESYAFALASAAVALELDGERVRSARIAVGGVATKPWRVPAAEQVIVGQVLTPALARRAGETAFREARPGHHNGFKVELGARVVAEALHIAKERA